MPRKKKPLAETIHPDFFMAEGEHPKAKTVGELITQLQRLPKDLPINYPRRNKGIALVVNNILLKTFTLD